MEEIHRSAIRKSWTSIIKNVSSKDASCIMDFLLQQNILTMGMVDEINCERYTADKTRKLMSIVQRRGPMAFETFINSLIQNDLMHIAEIVLNNVSDDNKSIQNNEEHTSNNVLFNQILGNTNEVNNEDVFLCSICMESRISVTLNPCGHTFCASCGDIFVNQGICCNCQQPVLNSIKIFL